MTDTAVIHIAVQAMLVIGKVSAPILGVSLAVGFAVSLFQSVTQVQEVTLTFVPKLLAIAVVLTFAGHWMLAEIVGFSHDLFASIPDLLHSASSS